MKKFTNIVLGLSLLASNMLFAANTIDAIYPLNNDDTPDYLYKKFESTTNVTKIAKSSLTDNQIIALFPLSNDDTVDYLKSNPHENNSSKILTVAKSALESKGLCALYPESDTDSPRKSC